MTVKVVTDLNVQNKEIRVTNYLSKNLFSNKCSDRDRRKKTNIKYNLPFCLWSLLPHRNLGPLVPLKICPDVINMHKSLHQFVPFQLYSELLQHDCHLHLAIGQDLHKRV